MIFTANKIQIVMKKSLKLIPYLLLIVVAFFASCEHCDEGDSDNQSAHIENIKNENDKNLE